VLFAWWGVHWIQELGARSVPRLHEISIDPRVLLFTLALSLGAGVIFGLAPALRVSSVALSSALGDASRGSSGGSLWGRGNRLRRLLVFGLSFSWRYPFLRHAKFTMNVGSPRLHGRRSRDNN